MFRFRRSKSFLGGLLKVNLSKTGISLTGGLPGAHVTLGRTGTVASIGVPGTGLSFRQRLTRFGSRRPINLGDE